MFYHSTSFRSRFAVLAVCILFGAALSCAQAEAQWWKFWKKRSTEDKVLEGKQVVEKPVGKDLKDVEKERKDAERALMKQQRKALKEEEKRREEVLRKTKDAQREIEKRQREILAQNQKNQRKQLRKLKSSSINPSGKRSSFLQRYRARKNSSDSFFLSN